MKLIMKMNIQMKNNREAMIIKTQKIGIDLGSYEIKISNLNISGKKDTFGPSLKFKSVGKLGEKRYFRSLKRNIQSYVENYEYEKVELYFTMSPNIEGATSATIMTLPSTENKILEKAIKFEIEEQNIVDNIANHHYMWDVIETISANESLDDTESTKLLLTTISRDIIFEIAQLRSIKWTVERVELQVSTLGRRIEENAVVIDLGHQSSGIYIYKEGKLEEIDSLYFRGDELNKSIQQIHSTPSYQLAEDLKHKVDISFNNEDDFATVHGDLIRKTSETLYEESQDVISEIKRILRRFELQDPLEPVVIDAIYYTGSGIKLNGLIELLKDSFEYEIKPLYDTIGIERMDISETFEEDVFERSASKAKENDTDRLKELKIKTDEIKGLVYEKLKIEIKEKPEVDAVDESESPVLTNNNTDEDIYFANAILATLKLDDELDLNYHKYLKYKFDFSSILIMTTAMAVTLFLGIQPIDRAYSRNIDSLNEAIQEQNFEVGNLESSRENLDSKKQENEELKTRVESLNDEKKWFSEVLYEIPEITPKEVIVEHVNINSGVVSIQGYSKDYTDIGAFAIGLESLGEYEILEIEDVSSSDMYIGQGLETDERKASDTMSKKFEMKLER